MTGMTKREFDRLQIGDYITNKEGELFKIDMDYIFGTLVQVLSATLQNTNKYKAVRIDGSNFHFFKRVLPC